MYNPGVASHEDDATLPSTEPPVASTTTAQLRNEVARYDLGPLLGRGGMGEVRLARDTRIDREVAVKVMRSELHGTDNVARFFREARVQGALEHPSVVPIHDLGVDASNNPYFVMKRLVGVTLASVLELRRAEAPRVSAPLITADAGSLPRERWSRRDLLDRFVAICLAMDLAHQRGIVHRDLKPANLMLGEFGETYVLDWGLARVAHEHEIREVSSVSSESGATEVGALLGTPGYMAPEQARGLDITPKADIYSLGCVLFEILTSSPALPRGPAALALTLDAPWHSPRTSHPDQDVPPELDTLCIDATMADPALRPNARQLAERVRSYLDGDRDLAQRKQIATGLIASAQAALARGDEASRMTALQDAGRAFALVPEDEVAQRLLVGIALQPPPEIPRGALAAADAERSAYLTRIMRFSSLSYVWISLGIALLFLFPLNERWPVALALALSVASGLVLHFKATSLAQMKSPWHVVILVANLGLLTAAGFIHGPLFVIPVFLIGSLASILAQPLQYPSWIVVATHALPIAILVGCELVGLTPSTFHVSGGQLHITPWVIDATPLNIGFVYALTLIAQMANSTLITLSTRNAQVSAQNRVHAHRWHLMQMLPGAAAPAPSSSSPPSA